jgi:hypothetical protein
MKKRVFSSFVIISLFVGGQSTQADSPPISLSTAYLQCKAWLNVASKVRSGAYRFPNNQQQLLSSIIPVCQNIQRIYMEHYKNLYDYQGYYNAITNNQGDPTMNAVLKAAYYTERQKIKNSGQNVLPVSPPSNIASPPAIPGNWTPTPPAPVPGNWAPPPASIAPIPMPWQY